MVMREGRVKALDFGLAKWCRWEPFMRKIGLGAEEN